MVKYSFAKNIVVFFITFSWMTAVMADCPKETGETYDCEFEQKEVEQALIGKNISHVFSYCLQETVSSPDAEGIQCRGPAMYEDNYGFFSSEIFEDRFLFSEKDRFGAHRIYFVKQDSGYYNIYFDRSADGKLNIDFHKADTHRSIPVTFDSELRPQFTVGSLQAGSNPPIIIDGVQFIHTRFYADLVLPGRTLRYHAINGPQRYTPTNEK